MDGLAGLRGLNHHARIYVHGHVLGATGAVKEEIARLQVAEGNGGRVAHLSPGVMGQADAHLTPGIGGESRAVEPRICRSPRRFATPYVGNAKLALGGLHRSGPAGGRRWWSEVVEPWRNA